MLYEKNPTQALKEISEELKLKFDDQGADFSQEQVYPSELDESLIRRENLLANARKESDDLGDVAGEGLPYLVGERLDKIERHALLKRLKDPTYPHLVDLVVADLQEPNFRRHDFGDFNIHGRLLPKQLISVGEKFPKVLSSRRYIRARLKHLSPNKDVSMRFDLALQKTVLGRQWEYIKTLPNYFNFLKGNLLYRRLLLDEKMGVYNKKRFVAYLELPRIWEYRPKKLKHIDVSKYMVRPALNCKSYGLYPPIHSGNGLVERAAHAAGNHI